MRFSSLLILSASLISLTACAGAKEKLGLVRSAPDEFTVVKRAPLEMPLEMASLPVPRPGVARPQELSPSQMAQQALFGTSTQAMSEQSSGEAAFLSDIGANEADPQIRAIVTQEFKEEPNQETPVVKRLLRIGSKKKEEPVARVVDAEAEAQRIRQNMESGYAVNEGETPTLKK
jgi:hypothetical protein